MWFLGLWFIHCVRWLPALQRNILLAFTMKMKIICSNKTLLPPPLLHNYHRQPEYESSSPLKPRPFPGLGQFAIILLVFKDVLFSCRIFIHRVRYCGNFIQTGHLEYCCIYCFLSRILLCVQCLTGTHGDAVG